MIIASKSTMEVHKMMFLIRCVGKVSLRKLRLSKHGVKGVNILTILGRNNSGGGNFKCRAPDIETYFYLLYWRNSKEISVAGTE